MRPATLAAGIVTLVVAACPVLSTVSSRAAAPSRSQQQGPMAPPSSDSGPTPAPSSPTQEPPMASQTLKVRTSLVDVFVTVRDHHNEIIPDLTQKDFTVYEDGHEQKISYFAKEVDMPITLGLMMDTSGSMDRLINAEQDTASRFVKEIMRPKDEAMVIGFDFDANLLADFTEDTNVLVRAIHHAQISSAAGGTVVNSGPFPTNNLGGTHFYDAIYLACHDELTSQVGRKALVALTDAEDEGSHLTLNDAVESAQRADAVVHVLLMNDLSEFYGRGMDYNGGSVAAKLADETGGRVIDVHNEKTLEKAFAEIEEELRSQYVLGYYPENANMDGSYRKIKVDVSRDGARIRARKGYYAIAPAM